MNGGVSLTEGVYLFIKSKGLRGTLNKINAERYYKARYWLAEHFPARRIRILDLACGTGFGSKILSSLGRVVGVDIDEDAIGYARQNYKDANICFKVGNGDDPGFLQSLGRFDAVASFATVEHLDNHHHFFDWVYGALHRGGAFVVSFPSAFTLDWAAPHHKRDISRAAARHLFRRHGFNIHKNFFQVDRLDMRHIIRESRTNENLPSPSLRKFLSYYLGRPDHFIRRMYQITVGGGVLFAHQQYLLTFDKT